MFAWCGFFHVPQLIEAPAKCKTCPKDACSALKFDVLAIWFALENPNISIWAKLVSFCAVAYALSSIDLIPDFTTVLSYLDDLTMVPL